MAPKKLPTVLAGPSLFDRTVGVVWSKSGGSRRLGVFKPGGFKGFGSGR